MNSASRALSVATTLEVRGLESQLGSSYALDITEGQPEGHAVRSCIIGLRLASELGLDEERRAALFYALLLKDLGCSSNAAKMCWLFQADDRAVKRDVKRVDWSNLLASAGFSLQQVRPGEPFLRRLGKVVGMAVNQRETGSELIAVRCERGAEIATMLGFPEETAQAILTLDEHWDGKGHPLGLRGEAIPIEGRICSLAQTMEVFIAEHDIDTACRIAQRRRSSWFDPELVRIFCTLALKDSFIQSVTARDARSNLQDLEPEDHIRTVDDSMLDRIAVAFSRVIDAKSPWTFEHSEGVANVATDIAHRMGLDEARCRELRLAALLHDIGKLGVSNLILDKPGRLTEDEYAQMRAHTVHTQRILERVSPFRRFADYAAAHHERLDGGGYHLGLSGAEIAPEARILAVADVCDALSAERPYRKGMPREQVDAIVRSDAGTAFCPAVVDAFLQR